MRLERSHWEAIAETEFTAEEKAPGATGALGGRVVLTPPGGTVLRTGKPAEVNAAGPPAASCCAGESEGVVVVGAVMLSGPAANYLVPQLGGHC